MNVPMNLKDYVKVYNVFDAKFCKKVVKIINDERWQKHQYNSYGEEPVSYEDDLSVVSGNLEIPEIKHIHAEIWNSLDRYIRKDFAFEWYITWNGFSLVRFNKYDKNTRMRIHCDHITSLFDGSRQGIPTLTVLGGLNDNYSGGELIFWNSEQIELKAGQIMIFPSNFMYPHEVRPITKGVRYSYVSWVW